ncbi:MAG: hypothetical protein GXN93_03100 [Candidatus Diapherotrites archaeon]|nr:hypothetical protein [Candidatus Diapherotrites archaeon]
MMRWGEVRRTLGIDVVEKPVLREKVGRKMIFWFKNNGDGRVAELVMAIKQKGIPVEIQWDENEGLTGICIDFTVIRS